MFILVCHSGLEYLNKQRSHLIRCCRCTVYTAVVYSMTLKMFMNTENFWQGVRRPYSQTRSSWSVIQDFIENNIFYRDFHLLSTKWSRWTNLHSHWSRLHRLSQIGSTNLYWRIKPEDSSHIYMYILWYACTERNKHLVKKIHILLHINIMLLALILLKFVYKKTEK